MNTRYVLVKSYYGMGGDLAVLLGAMQLCEQSGRSLVVEWNGGLYGHGGERDVFDEFFSSPTNSRIDAPARSLMSVFPPDWVDRLHLPPRTFLTDVDLKMSRPEDAPPDCTADCIVITRDPRHISPAQLHPFAKGLALNSRIQTTVDGLLGKVRQHRFSIGVHVRHGNGEQNVIAPGMDWYLTHVTRKIRTLDLNPHDVCIYVATDSAAVLDYFRRRFPTVECLPKTYRPNGEGAFHNGNPGVSNQDKMRLGEEALIDIWTLAQSDFFVGSSGYFSLLVRILRGDRPCIRNRELRTFRLSECTAGTRPIDQDTVFAPSLARHAFPTDGLYVREAAGVKQLLYYHDLLFSIPVQRTGITTPESLELRKAIVRRRLY